jgi:toxin ParE1/3/4
MQIIWSPTAIAQLVEIREYIEQDRPVAARGVAQRIVAAADQLSRNPHLGRPGRNAGIRELIVAGTPYILPYRIQKERIKILAVFHAARQWPE